MDFDNKDGTKELLRRLAASPLVRRSLPNAAAICQQYFAFKRYPNEPMHAFLVRESLGYQEFVGIQQQDKDFGLPDDPEPSGYDYEWWDREGWDDADWEPPPEPQEGDTEPRDGPGEAQERPERPPQPRGDSGSPHGGSSHGRTPDGRPPSLRSFGVQPSRGGIQDGINELSLADSFVLGVLRGFRLLQAAGLSPEDKRDILGTTRGSLEFETVTHALQTLWDEQFLGRHGPHNLMTTEMMYSYDEDWDGDDWWGHDAMYHDDSWDDGWGYYDWDEAYYTEPQEPSQPDHHSVENDVAIKEAQQAEKVAESLLADAQRTWSEAQRATQALRKDRGFGQHVGPQSHQVPRGPCFICWGPHQARDCPDRSHPGSHHSKGKSNYLAEFEEYTNYLISKGKGKGKKGKNAHWMDAQLWAKGKSKGKSKHSSAAPRPSVNAYMFTGGMEMLDFKELNSASSVSKMKDEQGLIDCGATASAGPLVAVESLISSVLAKDRQANIEVQSMNFSKSIIGASCQPRQG